MERAEVLARLRAHEEELRDSGLLQLAVFGSVAREQASDTSDVDLLGDFSRDKRLTLFDLAGLEMRLAEILGARVDLADRRMLKEAVKSRAEREAVLAF